MTWGPIQYGYLGLAACLVGLEMFAVFNDRPKDTITAMCESSPYLWVPMVVLAGWTLGHFTLGVWAERIGGIAMLILAPIVWKSQRPDQRSRN